MNTKQIRLWLAIAFCVGIFTSCNKDDRTEPNSPKQGSGKTVTLSLSAEIGFEEEQRAEGELKALNFKIEDVGGKKIPRPQLEDGQEVEVHTVIRSSSPYSQIYAKTLKWAYKAAGRKLVLETSNDPDKAFTIPNFNNQDGVKWYIAGLFAPGTTLTGTTVAFEGARTLYATAGTAGEAIGKLNVPYWLGWSEMTLHTLASDRSGNYLVGDAKSANNKFRPLGSLIAFKLGNRLADNHKFNLKSFILYSNTFGDRGTFELHTEVLSSTPQDELPKWTEAGTGSAMLYTFAPGHLPSTLNNGTEVGKHYYAWVMPNTTQPESLQTRVVFKGESSRPETATYRDYTKMYFTNYLPKSTGSQGKVTHGKVYSLTAHVTKRIPLPIEYLTRYNLAGGNGQTISNGTSKGFLNSPALGGVQPEGVRGPLRFSNISSQGLANLNPERNDQSGYYNVHMVLGIHHPSYNPNTVKLREDIEATFGGGRYVIPEFNHMRSIWSGLFSWSSYSVYTGVWPIMIGHDAEALTLHGGSDMSPLETVGNVYTDNAVFYSIRNTAVSNVAIVQYPNYLYHSTDYFFPLLDNSLRCAYRYTRVGGLYAWDHTSDNTLMETRLIIDVVYLGEEASPTTLSTISNASWWSLQQSAGKVITHTFPATGFIETTSQGSRLYLRGSSVYLLNGITATPGIGFSNVGMNPDGSILSSASSMAERAIPIRLYKIHPDQP